MTCKHCGNVSKNELCSVCADMKNEMDALFMAEKESLKQVEEQQKVMNKLNKAYREALVRWSNKANEYMDRRQS